MYNQRPNLRRQCFLAYKTLNLGAFFYFLYACIVFIYKKWSFKKCKKLVIVAKFQKCPKLLIAQEKSILGCKLCLC